MSLSQRAIVLLAALFCFVSCAEKKKPIVESMITVDGVSPLVTKDEFVAKGAKANGMFYQIGNPPKGDYASAKFKDNGSIEEIWGSEISLDGETLITDKQSSAEILKKLGPPSKSIEGKKFYYYVFASGGQRWALQIDALEERQYGSPAIGVINIDGKFQECEPIDMTARFRGPGHE